MNRLYAGKNRLYAGNILQSPDSRISPNITTQSNPMYYLIEKFGLISGYLMGAMFVFMRYAFMAGIAYVLFYVLWKSRLSARKIQDKLPRLQKIKGEIEHSLSTAFVFALIGVGIYFLRQSGHTRIYTDINYYGWAYLVFSFILLTVIHDTYFYWMHRLIHHPRLFPVIHAVHHHSHNPTPWAALAFHPLEAFAEIAIVPVIILWMPFHPLVLFAFSFWAMFWNVIGHLGYEIFPANFVRHPIGRWLNTSTHHNLHHSSAYCNYGLYYNFWDTLMGTNHKRYIEIYELLHHKIAQSRQHELPLEGVPSPGAQIPQCESN